MASGKLIPTRDDYKGAARLKIKTVEEMAKNRKAATENAKAADKAKRLPSAE